MSKIINLYKGLGNKTKLIIKTSIIFATTFWVLGIFANYAHFTPYHYKLLLISDELIGTAKPFLTIGLLGAFAMNYLEKRE